MKNAQRYIEEDLGIKFPKGDITGEWFAKHSLPIVVACSCCQTTMVLPSALIDEEGQVFCRNCVDEEDE
jgi:hypothetical protein